MCLARTRRCGPHRPTRHLICVGFPASTRGSRSGTRSAGFLVGDAAHVHSPIGGPGLNLGLQDAVNLGWKLAAVLSGRVEPTLLATYETERRPAAERVITQSRAQLALSSDRGLTALRELFSELVTDPANVRRLSDLLSGAENRYVTSADAHPLVGRWVPDFAVTKRQRNKTRRGARPRRTAAAR